MRRGAPPEQALARLAQTDGDPLQRATAYALALEPFRVTTLHVFTELGLGLEAHGASRLPDLPSDALTGYAADARAAAESLAGLPAPRGSLVTRRNAREVRKSLDTDAAARIPGIHGVVRVAVSSRTVARKSSKPALRRSCQVTRCHASHA